MPKALPVLVRCSSSALMKMMKIRGEDAPPWMTPVRKVMIALSASSESMHAVVRP